MENCAEISKANKAERRRVGVSDSQNAGRILNNFKYQ